MSQFFLGVIPDKTLQDEGVPVLSGANGGGGYITFASLANENNQAVLQGIALHGNVKDKCANACSESCPLIVCEGHIPRLLCGDLG